MKRDALILLPLVIGCGGPVAEPPAAAPDSASNRPLAVISAPLKLSSNSYILGDTVSASVTYRNDGASAVVLQRLIIATRPPGGTHAGGPVDDLSPSRGATTLRSGQTLTLQAARALARDDYASGWLCTAAVSDEAFTHAASLFRAVGDEQRLRLLERLATREWCVSELANAEKEGLSTISQRLKILRAEGLVSRRRDGKHLYNTIADQHVAELVSTALRHVEEQRGRPSPDEEDDT